jgi:hypothetical protein
VSEKNVEPRVLDKWTQFSEEQKQIVIAEARAAYRSYVNERGAPPDDVAKGEIAEKIYGIAVEKGILARKVIVINRVIRDITRTHHLEIKRQKRRDRRMRRRAEAKPRPAPEPSAPENGGECG